MNRLLLLLLGAAALLYLMLKQAPAMHLLHKLPKDVGDQILLECQGDFNGAFSQGWCADQRAEDWLDKHDAATRAKASSSMDLLVKPPDIIIRPREDDDQ